MKIPQKNSKRGIALIVVMIAVFVLSVLAGAFAYSMKVESKLAMNANNLARGRRRGEMDSAMASLRECCDGAMVGAGRFPTIKPM